MNAEPIKLSERAPFSHGKYRRCFVHPENPSLCIKVNHPDFQPEEIRRRARPWKRIRGLNAFDHTARELQYYREYSRFYGEAIWERIGKESILGKVRK